jgi:hypothetical protein
LSERIPSEGFVFYPDFPYDSAIWTIDPPSEYHDTVDTESFTGPKQEIK